MGTPLATAADLQSFLGVTTGFDSTRATNVLQWAQDLCESVINPLPAAAKGVVLGVAARVYSNPQGLQAQAVGPASAQYLPGTGGLYLTRGEKSALRRMNGGGGAFSITILPTGQSAVQLVTVTGAPTGGTFTLAYTGQVTSALPFNVTPAAMQAALIALPAIGAGGVTVTGTGPYTVTFTGSMANQVAAILQPNPAGLTGGTNPTVTVQVIAAGHAAPGQGLPPWDFDYNASNLPPVP